MTPAARINAVIELLGAIDQDARPADAVANHYFRGRRYIGAKDRRAISERVWGCLRRRARLGWWLSHAGAEDWPRERVLADLVLQDRFDHAALSALFLGETRTAVKLTQPERQLVDRLAGKDFFHHAMPLAVKAEFPAWLEDRLSSQFGDRLGIEMAMLREEAPVDLRVNSLKADRATAQAALAADGLPAKPTPWSPLGLRLPGRTALTAQQAFKDGLVEVQDEGSQLVALLTDAQPCQAVLDLCAGAGGKTLALAASMHNKGRLVACDTHAGRSARATLRLKRAGVHNVTRRVLEGPHDKWLKRQDDSFDRVLVDAPCSGSGTWRRNPDAKWRLTEAGLANLVLLQSQLLDQAARLVKPGGRLIYATCSLLACENEQQIEAFLVRHPAFTTLSPEVLWQSAVGGPCPVAGPFLRLTPAGFGTDGFFAAILLRAAGSSLIL